MNYSLYVWEIIVHTLVTIISSLVYLYSKYQEKNKFKRLFIPKNDSVWERLKVVLSIFMIIKLIEIICVGFNSNMLFATFISLVMICISNPIIFILVYSNTKHDILVQNIITNIGSIIVSLLLSIFIISVTSLPVFISYISILGIIIFLIFYIVATYFQTDDIIFLDPNSKKNKLKKDS